jgi:hypothetical protein
MTTETSNHATPLRVRFTRKPVDLQEVLAATPYDKRPEPVVISETRQLTTAEYDIFASTLLQDRDWLAGKGGTPTRPPGTSSKSRPRIARPCTSTPRVAPTGVTSELP